MARFLWNGMLSISLSIICTLSPVKLLGGSPVQPWTASLQPCVSTFFSYRHVATIHSFSLTLLAISLWRSYSVLISRPPGRETLAARYPSTCPQHALLCRTIFNQYIQATHVIGAVPMLPSDMSPLRDPGIALSRQKWILVHVGVEMIKIERDQSLHVFNGIPIRNLGATIFSQLAVKLFMRWIPALCV